MTPFRSRNGHQRISAWLSSLREILNRTGRNFFQWDVFYHPKMPLHWTEIISWEPANFLWNTGRFLSETYLVSCQLVSLIFGSWPDRLPPSWDLGFPGSAAAHQSPGRLPQGKHCKALPPLPLRPTQPFASCYEASLAALQWLQGFQGPCQLRDLQASRISDAE